MKELRFFYDPQMSGELPKDEAQHALRVLRLQSGDELNIMDGKGNFHRATITTATGHRCLYRVDETQAQQRAWQGHLHLAMAPTKNNDRTEWMTEKATEIGFDELSFLCCKFSERKTIKTERIEKIVVSAVKQSHKAWMPKVNEMTDFRTFITTERAGRKYICHCYDEADIKGDEAQPTDKPFLMDVLKAGEDATVLVGPEGDFSVDEVRLALEHGYTSVSLGASRLRTETAGLVAVHMMQLVNQNR